MSFHGNETDLADRVVHVVAVLLQPLVRFMAMGNLLAKPPWTKSEVERTSRLTCYKNRYYQGIFCVVFGNV